MVNILCFGHCLDPLYRAATVQQSEVTGHGKWPCCKKDICSIIRDGVSCGGQGLRVGGDLACRLLAVFGVEGYTIFFSYLTYRSAPPQGWVTSVLQANESEHGWRGLPTLQSCPVMRVVYCCPPSDGIPVLCSLGQIQPRDTALV